MQPKLEKVFLKFDSSIAVKREITPYMDYPWHYHPEFEIIFVEKSYGIRLMGSHIGHFNDGDLMFISPNLPHVWKNDSIFYQNNKNYFVDVYVIHFKEDCFTPGFFNLPELTYVRKLIERGMQGVLIEGKDHDKIATFIKSVYNSSGLERLIRFLQTLDALARTSDFKLLSNKGFIHSVNSSDSERIDKVMNFLVENYTKEIKIEEIASIANMNKSSFCRYFKYKTHKTCSQFLNEIRVAHACKLLINTNKKITAVCYETGYNNISHFNRQFKMITGLTAKEYLKTYIKNANLTASRIE